MIDYIIFYLRFLVPISVLISLFPSVFNHIRVLTFNSLNSYRF